MRKRRKSIASWLFLIVGFILLLVTLLAVLLFTARQGWLRPEWQAWLTGVLEYLQQLIPSDEWLKFLGWFAGIAVSAVAAALSLLATWHFAEINLPQRLEDLKKSHARDHLSLQPRFLALARRGLGGVVADVETSRLTFLRRWLSWWSEKEEARVLAASSRFLAREASALSAALQEAQHQQITAHLVRGYQHASQDDYEKAFEEFEAATKVRAEDIVSRDIAAGWARRINRQKRELELLREMQLAASSVGSEIDHARALRREAELLDKRKQESDWVQARQQLDIARDLLQPLVADAEARRELGRVLTLFCEVQCNRKRVGRLDGPLARMRTYTAGVDTHGRPEEPGGEQYGEERASMVDLRVAELRGDADAKSDADDSR